MESEFFSEIGEKSETEGKCIIASEGMEAPGWNAVLLRCFEESRIKMISVL